MIFEDKREQTFTKGSHIHEIIVGNGGQDLQGVCPVTDQDGQIYYKGTGFYGATTVEATSKKVTVTFYKAVNEVAFRVNVVQ